MHLGALIERLENEPEAAATVEALGDLVLYARLAAAAARYGETPGEYLAASVRRFSAAAPDEEWLGLVAAMERAEDPGQAALKRMLQWATAKDECAEPTAHDCSCGDTGV